VNMNEGVAVLEDGLWRQERGNSEVQPDTVIDTASNIERLRIGNEARGGDV